MRRDLGLWSVVRENAYEDPATLAAAEVLVRGGVPSYVAPLVVVTAHHRLECWAMRDGDSGATGHLPADRLAAIAWPEAPRGPRSIGRGEKLGNLLRAALLTPSADGGPGLLALTCGGGCAAIRTVKVGGTVVRTCPHEGFHSWTIRPPKIVTDRREKRDRAAAKAQAGPGFAPTEAPAPTGAAPGGIRSNVVRPSPEVRPDPIPTPTHRGEEEGLGAPVLHRPPTPVLPMARGGQAVRAGDVLRTLMEAPPMTEAEREAANAAAAAAAGAARARRAPGPGAGDGGMGFGGAAGRALLGAEPNVREQQRNGRDLTLRTGAYYLARIGAVRGDQRRDLERELGTAPGPGALLARAAPAAYAMLERTVASKWPLLTNPDAYVRSSLASAWTKFLEELEGATAAARHRAALEAAHGPTAATGSA